MKLSPVASSSDLDVAREIARRLHEQTRADRPAKPARRAPVRTRPASAPATPPHVPVSPWLATDEPQPPAPRRSASEPADPGPGPLASIALEMAEPPAPSPAPARVQLSHAGPDEPPPPSWDEPAPPATHVQETDDALDALTAPGVDLAVALPPEMPAIDLEEPEEAEDEVDIGEEPELDALSDGPSFDAEPSAPLPSAPDDAGFSPGDLAAEAGLSDDAGFSPGDLAAEAGLSDDAGFSPGDLAAGAGLSDDDELEAPDSALAASDAFAGPDALGGSDEFTPPEGLTVPTGFTPPGGVMSPDDLIPPDGLPGPEGLDASDELAVEAPEEEELFDTPPPPSWGEITESCMAMAHARGALLAGDAGQLVAVRGEWPEPGADAIAARLVAMMERALRAAPTRSVSAPVGPLHLTAWRVPIGERLLTVAFLADAPVRGDARPGIDAEIQRGAGA